MSRATGADPVHRRALLVAVFLLAAAAAALGGAAAAGWARVPFQVPLRGSVAVRVGGSDLLPALGLPPVLGPLALLALATVAAVLAAGGWARRLLGALLLGAAVVPGWAVARLAEGPELNGLVAAATAAGGLPARSVLDGTVTLLFWGPTLAVVGAVLLACAGVVLVLCGHRMPRMGQRYRAPTRLGPAVPTTSVPTTHHELWERIDAGEDPTVPGDPR
ncbi:MAG: Trp biosynthesis-associated membrane protein [Pseudonocardiales bacterium]